jgi:hypothetical protein
MSLRASHLYFLLALAAPISAGAGPWDVTDPGKNAIVAPVVRGWTFGAGAIYRQMGEVNFQSSSQLTASDLSSLPLPAFDPGSEVPLTGLVNRNYQNGFVFVDANGGADTTFWSYQNNSQQVPPEQLAFRGLSAQPLAQSSTFASPSHWSDDLAGAGFYLQIAPPPILERQAFYVDLNFTYSFSQDEVDHRNIFVAAERQSSILQNRFTDVYRVGGILPPAPYTGTFNGPGPTVGSTPLFRTGQASQVLSLPDQRFFSDLSETLQVRLHTFSLGPRVNFENGRLTGVISWGTALNLADWEAHSREIIRAANGATLRSYSSNRSETDALSGFFAELGTRFQLSERLFLSTSGRYDWSGTVTGNIGASTFEVDLGGWSGLLGLTLQY